LLENTYTFNIKVDFGDIDSDIDASKIDEELEKKEIVKPDIPKDVYVPAVPDINISKISRKGVVLLEFTKTM